MTYAKLKASGLEPRAPTRTFSIQRLMIGSPDLSGRLPLALLALAVTLIMAVVLGCMWWSRLDVTYGDTDDATRMVAVRALADGRGWWDQLVTRMQPPLGLWMHWSRLLDGGIAGLDRMFRLVLSTDDAEFATRFTWPLLWIFPAAWASLMSARRLGAGLLNNAAVIICAVILALDLDLYAQFHPGRIDHHDVQMTCAFLALAGAIQPGRNVGGALLAGIASALGTAVGLEALPFSAAIGAALALRFAFDRSAAPATLAYGLSLALASALAFGVQTPPWRWSVEACDALALNLVAALAVAGLGLAALARFGAGLRWPVRLGLLAGVGMAAGGVYLALYPNCIHGFFADVDPRIRPIWLNYVQEVKPIRLVVKHNLDEGLEHITPWTLGVVAWLLLGLRRARRRDFAWWLSGLMLALGIAAGATAIRMTGYAEWFGVPVIAAAAAEVLAWSGYRNWLAVLLAGAVASPSTAAGLSIRAADTLVPLLPHKGHKAAAAKPGKKAAAPADHCFDMAAYDTLGDQPAGLVLGDIDLGPHILANTDDSVLQAPYHRMGWGILKAHALFKAPADGAAADLLRQAKVAYVVECRMHAAHGDREDMGKTGLQRRLDAGQPPAWLQPLSVKSDPLQVYRVLPPGQVAGPAPTAAPPTAPLAAPKAG